MSDTPLSHRLDEIKGRVNTFAFDLRPLTVKEAQAHNRDSLTLLSIIEDLTTRLSQVEAGWQPIETAPKGYPALGDPSEWFEAYGPSTGPTGSRRAIIRRVFGNGFGPWLGTGDEYYRAEFFTHWRPLCLAPVLSEGVR